MLFMRPQSSCVDGNRVRPTLMRRSPVLLFALMIGLTFALSTPVSAGFDYSAFGYRSRVLYIEGDHRQWQMGESFIEAQFSRRAFGLSWGLSLSYIVPSGDLRFGYYGSPESAPAVPGDAEGGRLSGRIRFQEPYSSGSLNVRTIRGLISTTVTMRQYKDDRSEASAAIWLHPVRFIRTGFTSSKIHPLPPGIELYFEPYSKDGPIAFEGGNLDLRSPARVDDVEAVISPNDRFTVDIRSRDARFVPDRHDYGDDPMGTYTGHLYGRWSDVTVGARYVSNSGLSNAFRFREMNVELDSLVALDGGLKFAYFGVVRACGHRWEYEVKDSGWYASVSIGDAEGELKGVVQAWPFLRGLYHFLGERRHLILDGKLSWLHASTGSSVWRTGNFLLKGALDYMQIRPDLRYSTWRPAFLGMGVDDLREGRLDVVRADLVRIQLNPSLTYKRWRLTLNVSQWVPISVKKTVSSSVSAPSESPGDKSSIWGGFFLSIALEINFI